MSFDNTPPLREYQKTAIFEIAKYSRRYAFYFDTGTGKTRTACGIVRNYPGMWAIVTPRSVFPAWIEELSLWGEQCWTPVSYFHKKRWSSKISSTLNGRVVLLTPQTLVRSPEVLRGIDCLVVDESSLLCNPKAKITKIVTRQKWDRVYLLSGNPSPQGQFWLWGQAFLLGATNQTWWQWANNYGIQIQIPGKHGGPWRLRPGAGEQILEQMQPFSWYIDKKTVLNLEDPTIIDRFFEPESSSPKWDALLDWVREHGDLMRIREIASGFLYTDKDGAVFRGDDSRIDALMELLEELRGRRVVVWCQFRAFRVEVIAKIKESGRVVYEKPEDFCLDATGEGIFVSHPRSAGYGTDGMQKICSEMVFAEASFSYDEFFQSLSRLHRSGQESPVVVYRLRANGSEIEDRMWAAVEKKSSLLEELKEALS